MEVAGSTVLVTGASSGIGSEVAARLSGAGADVIVHGRDPDRTAAVARRVRGTPVVADLHQPAGADTLVERARAVNGRVDVLVAGAGYGWAGPFTAMADETVDDLVGVNLLAVIRLVRHLLPAMLRRGAGHVVLLTSVAGRTGVAGEAVYAATKGGLDAFAESLRLELAGTGVGVSVVVPAAVSTEFFARRGRPYQRTVPRPVPPARVAAAVTEAIRHDRAEAWVPRWVRVADAVRVLAPAPYRLLAARLGEPVRSTSARTPGEEGPR